MKDDDEEEASPAPLDRTNLSPELGRAAQGGAPSHDETFLPPPDDVELSTGEYMDPLDIDIRVREIIEEINAFRRNPRKYAKEMNQLTNCYNGNILSYPDSGVVVETIEGEDALQDCLQDLMNASPLPVMTVSQALSNACLQHLTDLRVNDFCSHIGTDGSTPEERLTRFGEHREQCGENVVFGMLTAKEVVYQMLIDDGSPERGHRANLLNMDFHFLGLAHGSHPSMGTGTVLLLVDHFTMKQISALEQMRNVTEDVIGRPVREQSGVPRAAVTRKAWDRLMQNIKPDHLMVPPRLLDHVHRNDRPKLYREKHLPVSKYPVGKLAPKPGIDPAIVRAFVHRIDKNHDDCIIEDELRDLCHHHQLNVTSQQIAELFDEIVNRRPWHDRNRREVDWGEIFTAMKAHKDWVPAVDVHVERDGDKYQLTFEVDELEHCCSQLYDMCRENILELTAPPSFSSSSKSVSRNRSGGARIRQVNQFLNAILTSQDAETGEPLQNLPAVQRLLGRPGTTQRREIFSAKCMSQRRLWAHLLRPHRQTWLLFLRTVGLHPLVPIPVHKPPVVLQEQPVEKHLENAMKDRTQRNVVKPPPKYTGIPNALAQMRTADLPPRVQVRAPETEGEQQEQHPPLARSTSADAQEQAVPWEEKRKETEIAVNRCLKPGNSNTLGATATGGINSMPAPEAEMAYTFEARRRFRQLNAKQESASEEQRYLGSERRASAGRLGKTGIGGYAVGPPSAAGLGPPNHELRSRGSGSFSRSAPAGVRGHFHNTLAIYHEEAGSHRWPQSLSVNWDGEHIDHARAAPQKDVSNFGQPAGYSTMTKEERGRQFTTYFKNKSVGLCSRGGEGTRDCFAAKATTAADQIKAKGEYADWKRHDFREDNPRRLGKFGRRDFDPQVREKPTRNPHNVSQIEDKPMEEFFRQQERVHDFLQRALPPGQRQHFQQYQPQCEQPKRHEDMASRQPNYCLMDGDQKQPQKGFGQNRHSDHARDYRLYTRPLDSCQLDKMLPMVP